MDEDTKHWVNECEAAEFLTHPMFSPGFRRFGRYDTID